MENKRYLHCIRETLNLVPEDEHYILTKLRDFQEGRLKKLGDRFGYSMEGFESRMKNRTNILKEDVDRMKVERGIVPLEESDMNKERFFGNLTILYQALKAENPDRVIGILRGGAGYASLAELFGYEVDYIEAHHEKSLNFRGDNFENSTIERLSQESRVLLVEDSFVRDKRKRTYEIVKDYLVKQFNIRPTNFSLFVGGLPSITLESISEHNRILGTQNTYSNYTLIEWGNGNYEETCERIANEAEIPLPLRSSEEEGRAMNEEMTRVLREKLK